MASVPIRSTVVTAAPKDYAIPPSQEIILLSVTAEFIDNGAAGDWLPAVVILDNNGNALCRAVDQGVKVTAGGDAEVSWFPGVKPGGGAGGTAVVNKAFLYVVRRAPLSGQPLQTIPPGVPTPIIWKGVSWHGGALPGAVIQPVPGDSTITWDQVGANEITLTVLWPANTYDRYIELTVDNPEQIGTIGSPRLRTSASPDGDVMTLSATIFGDPALPTSVTATAYNGSGGNQDINAEMVFWAVMPDVTIA